MYVNVSLNRFGNSKKYGGQIMETTTFILTNYDGCQWWRTTITVNGLSNIMLFVKIRGLNDLEFLYKLKEIGAIQLTETSEIIHP
jgi:hypothetical protein